MRIGLLSITSGWANVSKEGESAHSRHESDRGRLVASIGEEILIKTSIHRAPSVFKVLPSSFTLFLQEGGGNYSQIFQFRQ